MTKCAQNSRCLVLAFSVGLVSLGCGGTESGGGSGGASSSGSGGAVGSGGASAQGAGGALGSGGANAMGGTNASAGAASGGSASGGKGNGGGGSAAGGKANGSGGSAAGGKANGSGGGASAQGGATQTGDNCTVGKWPAADPTATGPYATVTENEVGPEAGVAEDDGTIPKFTLFRPKDLSPGGLCHPVITWGNGTGSTPSLYKSLLNLFASHGFIVIGSNSKNVGQGQPQPMLVGVTWILSQNDDPSSALYHHIDVAHIGATGHSQGAFATSAASGDSRIVTSVPIEGSQVQRNLHGPAMFFCGGMDDVVGCSGAQSAINAITTLPAMYAEYLSVDHGSWMSFGNKPSPVYAAVTAWMRVHLMADDALRPWFYGASCKLCTDTGWQIQQKNMDQ